MRLEVENLAQPGLITDVPDELLPNPAWTDSRNVRYRDGAAEKTRGYERTMGSLSATAIWAQSITDGTNVFWVYGSNSVLYATDGTTHTDVSHLSIAYSATDDLGWTGGAFHGFMLANDGSNVPQVWDPSLGNNFESLTAWPAITCRVMRPFKDFIFALRVTDSGTGAVSPRTLRWSDKAGQGALPQSWDFQDPTNQAGITELAQTNDLLVDCGPLRDSLVIYKENHIWLAEYIGGLDVFSFRQVISQQGLLTENCFAVTNTFHVVMGDNDLILHDGNTAKSIADKRIRRWLFNRISSESYRRSFVVADYRNREVYFCFPEGGYAWPNLALAWNWYEDTFHVYDLGEQLSFGASGVIPGVGVSTTFDDQTGTFDEDTGTFDEGTISPFLQRMVVSSAVRKHLYQADTGETYNGIPMSCYARRTGTIIGKDVQRVNRVMRLTPKVIGTPGDVLNFYVGTRETVASDSFWSGPYRYVIGVDYQIDLRPVPGRLVDVRVEYTGTNTFRLFSYGIEFEPDGMR